MIGGYLARASGKRSSNIGHVHARAQVVDHFGHDAIGALWVQHLGSDVPTNRPTWPAVDATVVHLVACDLSGRDVVPVAVNLENEATLSAEVSEDEVSAKPHVDQVLKLQLLEADHRRNERMRQHRSRAVVVGGFSLEPARADKSKEDLLLGRRLASRTWCGAEKGKRELRLLRVHGEQSAVGLSSPQQSLTTSAADKSRNTRVQDGTSRYFCCSSVDGKSTVSDGC